MIEKMMCIPYTEYLADRRQIRELLKEKEPTKADFYLNQTFSMKDGTMTAVYELRMKGELVVSYPMSAKREDWDTLNILSDNVKFNLIRNLEDKELMNPDIRFALDKMFGAIDVIDGGTFS